MLCARVDAQTYAHNAGQRGMGFEQCSVLAMVHGPKRVENQYTTGSQENTSYSWQYRRRLQWPSFTTADDTQLYVVEQMSQTTLFPKQLSSA